MLQTVQDAINMVTQLLYVSIFLLKVQFLCVILKLSIFFKDVMHNYLYSTYFFKYTCTQNSRFTYQKQVLDDIKQAINKALEYLWK